MKAYELLLQKGWCQGDYALSENGGCVSHTSPNAAQFCLLGAICACYQGEAREQAVHKVANQIPREFHRMRVKEGAILVRWNDTEGRTRPQVVALLKEVDI